ncbi:MAG: hypothetical protein HGB05_17835 [Chloroflexi bacterium]|nr:hypothetical protein [Chloroflexota bacterium]
MQGNYISVNAAGTAALGNTGRGVYIREAPGNVVGGVTSFGKNGNCAGTGGVYRVDRADDLNWLYDTFGDHLP